MEQTMFRRFRNPALNGSVLGPAQMELLHQANQFLASGQPDQAAPLFARLAGTMESEKHPRRAANLHAQASNAYADSQAEQSALAHARSALTLFIQYQMVQRTPVFYANITHKLTNHGMKASADTLVREFGPVLGGLPVPTQPAAVQHASLPTNCPKCGAPLNSSEATWINSNTAECAYCGAGIRGG
jgi:hypothetical protein